MRKFNFPAKVSFFAATAALLASLGASALADGGRSPASAAPIQETSHTLNVNGQVRSLSMLPVSKKDKDKLEFGKARINYKDKVDKTIF